MSLVEASFADFVSAPGQLLIGGRWAAALSGETIEVIDPATGHVFAEAAAGAAADVDAAVSAARTALESPGWANMPVHGAAS